MDEHPSGLNQMESRMLRNRHVRFGGGGPGKPTSRKAAQVAPPDPYTFVPTWAGVAYVCFLTDAYSRMIVGWRVAGHMRTSMVLDAIEMARWSRGKMLAGLRCHSDAGLQFTSIRYGERLAEIGAVPSIGTVGDSFDNALAETVNGYYKSELIYGPTQTGPWKTIADAESATLGWVHWHNTSRLHGYLDDLPPAEFEATFYATKRTDQPWSTPEPEPPHFPGRFTTQNRTRATANLMAQLEREEASSRLVKIGLPARGPATNSTGQSTSHHTSGDIPGLSVLARSV